MLTIYYLSLSKPALVAQSDACLTGDQVTGLIPARADNILWWRFSLPLADSRRAAAVSFYERICTSTGYYLED